MLGLWEEAGRNVWQDWQRMGMTLHKAGVKSVKTKKPELGLNKIAAGILLREDHLSDYTTAQELPHNQCSHGIC